MDWQGIGTGLVLVAVSAGIGIAGYLARRFCHRLDSMEVAIRRLLRAAGLPERDEEDA